MMEETTMTIEEMKNRKRELGYTIDKLSALSGVPVSTLRKLFSDIQKVLGRIRLKNLSVCLRMIIIARFL